MFLDLLAQAAEENCQLDPSETLLVGVSGGGDSVALMIGLHTLGFNLVVAHLDHGLRSESSQDADYVESLAQRYRIPFVRERIDVGYFAKKNGQSLEEAARHVRYKFLYNQARANKAQAVAVAHQANDQVETILMHFIRGAALAGLSGMAYRQVLPMWDSKIPLVRPLLGVWREVIDEYLAALDVTPCIDQSNQDTTYFRNRLRHELIPDLVTYNPAIRQVILRMSTVLGEENQFLQGLVDEAWGNCFLSKNDKFVELHLLKFVQMEKTLQRRVLRHAITMLRPDIRDVGFNVVEQGLVFATEHSKNGQIDLVARLNIAILGDILIIKTWDADLPDLNKPLLLMSSTKEKLDANHPVQLRHGWQLIAETIQHPSGDFRELFKEMDLNEAWLDYDRLILPLTVRGRQRGDSWQPLGMSGHSQKLQDFFINEKVPEHIRDIWPLVCSGKEIAWVCGLRPSETYKVTEKTQHIMQLRLVKVGD